MGVHLQKTKKPKPNWSLIWSIALQKKRSGVKDHPSPSGPPSEFGACGPNAFPAWDPDHFRSLPRLPQNGLTTFAPVSDQASPPFTTSRAHLRLLPLSGHLASFPEVELPLTEAGPGESGAKPWTGWRNWRIELKKRSLEPEGSSLCFLSIHKKTQTTNYSKMFG